MSKKVLQILEERRVALVGVEANRQNWSKITAWHARTRPLISQHFREELEAFDRLIRPQWVAYPRVIASGLEAQNARTDAAEAAANERVVVSTKEKLLGHIDALIELLDIEDVADAAGSMAAQASSSTVFLVHGHNERWLQEVARFVEQFDLELVILREEPNQGRTVIEKFERYAANAGFAIVLLTADDKGGVASEDPATYRPRARQNAILELGYFLAKLGRARVCALYEQDVEIPSDYSGVIFVHIDGSGGWRLLLGREMKAAGLPVDMNRVI
jgi:predicted nucleotide-binding protein